MKTFRGKTKEGAKPGAQTYFRLSFFLLLQVIPFNSMLVAHPSTSGGKGGLISCSMKITS